MRFLLTILCVLVSIQIQAQEILKTVMAENEPLAHSYYRIGDTLHIIGISQTLSSVTDSKEKYKIGYYLNTNKEEIIYDWIYQETLSLSDADIELFKTKIEYFNNLAEENRNAKLIAKQQDEEAKKKAAEDEKRILDAKLQEVKNKYVNGVIIDYGLYVNNAGGIHPLFSILNNSSKEIKYVDIYFKVLNSVGDVCEIKYQDSNICKLRGTGPIKVGDSKDFNWAHRASHYTTMAGTEMSITKMVLIFTDGTSKTLSSNFVLEPPLRKYVPQLFYNSN